MNRTYNVFVDNGLFVLAYYLDKEIEDITEQDIFNNIDMMCEKIIQMFGTRSGFRKEKGCEKYSKIKEGFMLNSALTNSSTTISYSQDLKRQIYSNVDKKTLKVGEEHCSYCGEDNVNIFNNFSRKDIPNIVAHIFYNFSNNLKGINICNKCFILTIYSILNVRQDRLIYLYNSDNDEFMYDYTYEIQEENKRDIFLKAKLTDKKDYFNITERLLNGSKLYNGYIQIYKFKNGKNQDLEIQDINSDNVKLLSKITKSGLLNEFKELGLIHNLIRGDLRYTYLSKIIKDDELKCSIELFDMLNREVNMLREDIKKVIKDVSDRLINEDRVKIIKKLKLIKRFNDFESLLIEIGDNYFDKYNESLFSVEEYELIDNKLKYNQIKNLLIVNLMQ